ncbi:MAG TPA: monovalent cation/H+ antiporter complex subunit F, partial [Acidothermaceae bacterium]|nr:monovalent cation/H+ antiporter complex subunit F [Acidothermaceae bacterium]
WYVASIILLIGGMGPAMLLASRRGPTDRLIGLALGGSIAVLTMLVLSQAYGQSSYLIVPLVLATLSVTGVLVFTRLLGPR